MKLHYLILSCFLLVAVSARAQVDPQDNGIGIYADQGGLTNQVDVEVGTALEVYLLLTRPTGTGMLAGWECSIVAPDNVSVWGYSYPNSGTLGLVNTPNFLAAFPRGPFAAVNLLMTFIVVPLDSNPAQFYVAEYTGQAGVTLPRYVDWNGDLEEDLRLVDMHPYPDDSAQASFIVNPGSVPVAIASWGGVKALYR